MAQAAFRRLKAAIFKPDAPGYGSTLELREEFSVFRVSLCHNSFLQDTAGDGSSCYQRTITLYFFCILETALPTGRCISGVWASAP